MSTHFFIDETKAKSYVVVAVMCPGARLAQVRATLGQLVLPRQRSIHMKTESAQRRRLIADVVVALADQGVRAHVFNAGRGPESELDRRGRCLDAICREAVDAAPARIVLDFDETLVASDRRRLFAAVPPQRRDVVTYEHARRSDEQLLALPDTIAWCWARGGEWRRRVSTFVQAVCEV